MSLNIKFKSILPRPMSAATTQADHRHYRAVMPKVLKEEASKTSKCLSDLISLQNNKRPYSAAKISEKSRSLFFDRINHSSTIPGPSDYQIS